MKSEMLGMCVFMGGTGWMCAEEQHHSEHSRLHPLERAGAKREKGLIIATLGTLGVTSSFTCSQPLLSSVLCSSLGFLAVT